MDLQLKGKRALVTGSTTGIGAGIASVLAAEGAFVVIHGRHAERARAIADQICSAGGEAVAILGDLETASGAETVIEHVDETLGGLDILINNAGGTASPTAPISWLDVPPEQWMLTYNKNVIAGVRLIHAFVPGMKERGWGRIINVSSYAAQSTSGGLPDYAAAKNGIVTLTLGLSKTLAFTGITVNTVSPGVIRTDATDPWLDAVSRERKIDRATAADWVLTNMVRQTVNRMGFPEDIGNAIAFLCSPRADFINGANVRVDGGASPATN